jgi:hypothetical protein
VEAWLRLAAETLILVNFGQIDQSPCAVFPLDDELLAPPWKSIVAGLYLKKGYYSLGESAKLPYNSCAPDKEEALPWRSFTLKVVFLSKAR